MASIKVDCDKIIFACDEWLGKYTGESLKWIDQYRECDQEYEFGHVTPCRIREYHSALATVKTVKLLSGYCKTITQTQDFVSISSDEFSILREFL